MISLSHVLTMADFCHNIIFILTPSRIVRRLLSVLSLNLGIWRLTLFCPVVLMKFVRLYVVIWFSKLSKPYFSVGKTRRTVKSLVPWEKHEIQKVININVYQFIFYYINIKKFYDNFKFLNAHLLHIYFFSSSSLCSSSLSDSSLHLSLDVSKVW